MVEVLLGTKVVFIYVCLHLWKRLLNFQKNVPYLSTWQQKARVWFFYWASCCLPPHSLWTQKQDRLHHTCFCVYSSPGLFFQGIQLFFFFLPVRYFSILSVLGMHSHHGLLMVPPRSGCTTLGTAAVASRISLDKRGGRKYCVHSRLYGPCTQFLCCPVGAAKHLCI